jgi:signal transduction histidine kinase
MTTPDHLTPDVLVPRVGDYLLEKGLITATDLQRALLVQEEQRLSGKSAQIGQVLLYLGMVDRPTLDQAITEQVIQLRTALQDANQQLEQRVKERTAELQVALKKLSELNQLKTNIISNVSHELRTPLTYILGYLDLLSTGSFGPLTSDQNKALDIIKKSTDRLGNLINDLLRFSTTSQGEFSLQLAELKPALLAQYAVNQTKSKAVEKFISLETHIPPDLPDMIGDAESISWVLVQLLDNAVKFSPENSRVILSAERDGKFIKIAATDTGIGIPADRIPDVFEPFHQLDGSSTRHYGGTGLGLALVRQIVEAHGSVIRVYSQVGKGSRFEFFLPIALRTPILGVDKKASDAKRHR